jgi:endonuclease-3
LNIWEGVFSFKIKSIWLYNSKAKNIFKLSNRLVEEYKGIDYMNFSYGKKCLENTKKYWYCIPDKLIDLMSYSGVWEKTAKVFLNVVYWQDVIAVDTHVHRVSNRIWIVKTIYPIQTSKKLEKLIPNKLKWIAHHTMIFWWRYQCIARKPKCSKCPLKRVCDFQNKEN